jgi:hypothetical protein
MSNEERSRAILEQLHSDAVAWVKKEGAEVRRETSREGVLCVVVLRGQERQQLVRGTDADAWKSALVHAVDEMQNSMPPSVEGP